MADTPILKIPVNADDGGSLDKLLEKLARMQEHMQAMPEGWKNHAQAVNNTGEALGGAFGQVQKFSRLADSSKLTGQNSFIFLFAKESKETEKSWFKITREVQTVQKSFANIARSAVTFGRYGLLSSLTGFGALGLGAYGLLSATDKTTHDLAAENQRNRALGLKPGQEQAFNIDFAKYGLGGEDLHKMADAQGDLSQWPALQNLGLSQNQIKNGSPADLEIQAFQKVIKKAREWTATGRPLAMFMQSPYGKFFSADQVRTGLSYSDEDLAKTAAQFPKDTAQQAIEQAKLDQATKQQADLDSALSEASRQLKAAFLDLTPQIVGITKAFAGAVTSFLRSPEVKQDLDAIASGLGDFLANVKAFNDFVHPLLPKIGQGGDALDDAAIDLSKKAVEDSKTLWQHLKNGEWRAIFGGIKSGASASDWSNFDWRHPFGRITHTAPPTIPKNMSDIIEAENERTYHLPAGLQAVQAFIESGNNPSIVNKKTGATGLFQLMPGTAKQMGVDPLDPVASSKAAAKLVRQYADQWGGNLAKGLAQYDGDTHIGQDTAKFGGNWLAGAKPETLKYLESFVDKGIPIGLKDEEKDYLKQQVEALKKAKTDAEAAAASSAPEHQQYFTMPPPRQQQSSVASAVRVALTVNTPTGADVNTNLAAMAGGYIG